MYTRESRALVVPVDDLLLLTVASCPCQAQHFCNNRFCFSLLQLGFGESVVRGLFATLYPLLYLGAGCSREPSTVGYLSRTGKQVARNIGIFPGHVGRASYGSLRAQMWLLILPHSSSIDWELSFLCRLGNYNHEHGLMR